MANFAPRKTNEEDNATGYRPYDPNRKVLSPAERMALRNAKFFGKKSATDQAGKLSEESNATNAQMETTTSENESSSFAVGDHIALGKDAEKVIEIFKHFGIVLELAYANPVGNHSDAGTEYNAYRYKIVSVPRGVTQSEIDKIFYGAMSKYINDEERHIFAYGFDKGDPADFNGGGFNSQWILSLEAKVSDKDLSRALMQSFFLHEIAERWAAVDKGIDYETQVLDMGIALGYEDAHEFAIQGNPAKKENAELQVMQTYFSTHYAANLERIIGIQDGEKMGRLYQFSDEKFVKIEWENGLDEKQEYLVIKKFTITGLETLPKKK